MSKRARTETAAPGLALAYRPLPPAASPTLLKNVLMPTPVGGYSRSDILFKDGKIAYIGDTGTPLPAAEAHKGLQTIDCTERMLLPGFVNAHTHSVEHWARGLIKPLPLELWVQQLIRHEPRGDEGWLGKESFGGTPAEAIGISAAHAGVEALLSGCTAVMDHLFIRDIDDLAAAVAAYKALGVRAFIAPMLNDDAAMYENYIPRANDARARNKRHNNCCGGMCADGAFRTHGLRHDAERTKQMLALWELAVERYHDPANGVEIVIGPVTAYSASMELLRGATEMRKKHNLCGHTHLLETRAQALMAKQSLPSGEALEAWTADGGALGCTRPFLRATCCKHAKAPTPPYASHA